METIFCHEACKCCAQFKSYYVVWKLNPYIPLKNSFTLFKSYYVVWKQLGTNYIVRYLTCLNRTMQYGNYYYYILLCSMFGSLNRTMQYGNLTAPATIPTTYGCLNRTMQYGNDRGRIGTALARFGLNRTMQYGNYF